MADPTSLAVGSAAAATGAAIWLASIGIDPTVLAAGLVGGWWVQSLSDPLPLGRRIVLAASASALSSWLAPPAGAVLSALLTHWLGESATAAVAVYLTPEWLKFPAAIGVGFSSHKMLGPALLKLAVRRIEGADK